VKELAGQIAEAEKEAKAADALAAKPPADVPADERADYVKEKRDEAKAAREQAKEYREQLAEAQKAVAAARANAATAAARVKDPEVVPPADAKDVQDRNQSHVDSAKGELKAAGRWRKGFLTEMAVHSTGQWAESLGGRPTSRTLRSCRSGWPRSTRCSTKVNIKGRRTAGVKRLAGGVPPSVPRPHAVTALSG
jgi:hypothetical protein